MLNKGLRIGLASALFILAIWMFIEGEIGTGIMWFLLAGLVLLTYFRNERILMSFWYLRKNNFEKAEGVIDRIKNPEQSLIKSQLAYFYFLKGMIESQRGIGKAETMLKKALNTGLRMKQDQAMAKLQLAGIAIAKRRKREATNLLAEVKKLDSKGLLDDQVKYIKQGLKKI